jgi:hypothetical protein
MEEQDDQQGGCHIPTFWVPFIPDQASSKESNGSPVYIADDAKKQITLHSDI